MLRAALLLVVACTGLGTASAQTFPKFTGSVVDAANVIPDAQEAALTTRLQDLQKTTGNQLVVATIPPGMSPALNRGRICWLTMTLEKASVSTGSRP